MIAGSTMICSETKNYAFIIVLINVAQYDAIMQEHGGVTSLATRQNLTLQTFSDTTKYDANISDWLSKEKKSYDIVKAYIKNRLYIQPTQQKFVLPMLFNYKESPYRIMILITVILYLKWYVNIASLFVLLLSLSTHT